MKCGHAFVEPGAWVAIHAMGEGVSQDACKLIGRAVAKAGGEQRAGLKGRVVGIGQVEEGELGARVLAEPALKKWRDSRRRRQSRTDGDVVFGDGAGREVGAGWRLATATKRLGASKPRAGVSKCSGGDAGDVGTRGLARR